MSSTDTIAVRFLPWSRASLIFATHACTSGMAMTNPAASSPVFTGPYSFPSCTSTGGTSNKRWGRIGETAPWYPSMRLFRQTEAGDWDGVFARIAAALAARMGK